MSVFLHTVWQAATWTVVAGLVASVFAWHPVRRVIRLLEAHAHHQRRIAEMLSARSPDGMAELVDAVKRRGDGR